MGVTAMCASGNAGLLTAKQWIDSGMATDVIVVATDISATPENVKPFVDLGVCVADRAPLDGCRPFQEGSGGFIVGEASVAMVMSSSPNGGYARVLGGAMTQDAHHVISIEPSYAQLRRCWTTGLASAGVHPLDIAYLNAHGPGTRQCDTAEAALFDELLPAAAGIYSFKPLTGHCQGAAAARRGGADLPGLRQRLDPGAAAGGRRPPPPRLRAGPPGARAGGEVVDRHGRQQLDDRPRRADRRMTG